MAVPLFDTTSPLAPLRGPIADAITGVIDDGRFILGPNVAAFEQEFAAYCGAAEAVGVANGTDALTIALRAMGVGPGDDVVVPSFTFYASAEAIPPTGARPVFCDVDPDTMCVTAETVRAADALVGVGSGKPNVDAEAGVIRLPVGDAGPAVTMESTRQLDDLNIRLAGFALHRPTLDDVFLSITGHAAEQGTGPEPDAKGRRRKRERKES